MCDAPITWVQSAHLSSFGELGASLLDGKVRFIDRETGDELTVTIPPVNAYAMRGVYRPTRLTEAKYAVLENALFTINGRQLFIPQTFGAGYYVRGAGMAQREVWHYVTREHCQRLRAGLTIHRSVVSSTPHEFERQPEADFEEYFYFLTDGVGLLERAGMWTDGTLVDDGFRFDGPTLAQVPMGYHRVVALPDADGNTPFMAYIWCYLCKKPEWEKD